MNDTDAAKSLRDAAKLEGHPERIGMTVYVNGLKKGSCDGNHRYLHERQAEILRLPQFMGQELGQQRTHLPIGRLSAPQDHRRVHERRGIYNKV